MSLHKFYSSQTIYYHQGFIRSYENIVLVVEKHLSKREYKRVFSYENIYSFLDKKEKYYAYDSLILHGFAYFDNEVDAKAEALSLLNEYSRIIKNLTGLFLLEGYNHKLKEDVIASGFIGSNDHFYPCFKAYIDKEDDLYRVDFYYLKEIIDGLVLLHNDLQYFPYLIIDNKIGVVVLDKNDITSKQKMNEFIKKYEKLNPLVANLNLGASEKFNYIEKQGIPYIIQIKKHGILSVKDVYKKDFFDYDENEFLDILDKRFSSNKEIIFTHTMENVQECLNSKANYFCKDCLNKIEITDDVEIIRPFSQRNKNVCCLCQKDSPSKLLFFVR